jgi:2,4-dienoyl-CoA reductase-like NADH-dependent reductase (Old Yellow Enzyme family)
MSSRKSFLKYILFFILISFTFQSKSIFDETTLRHLKLKNRIFRAAVGDNCFKDGKISEKGLELYDQLSKNEVGTIFTGYTAVSDYTQIDGLNSFRIDKDEYIPEFKKLVDLVHKNGANIMMQLAHIGMNTVSKAETIYAPSSLPIPDQNRFSKEMTKEDILRIENNFADAALRAKKAGFDGIEIHGAHFYLISEFLSLYIIKELMNTVEVMKIEQDF